MLAENVYLVKKGTKDKTVGANKINIKVSCIPVFARSRLLETLLSKKQIVYMVILM